MLNDNGQRSEGIPAACEMFAGIVLAGISTWRLASPAGALADMASTLLFIVMLLVGIALMYLGVERILDKRRNMRETLDRRYEQSDN